MVVDGGCGKSIKCINIKYFFVGKIDYFRLRHSQKLNGINVQHERSMRALKQTFAGHMHSILGCYLWFDGKFICLVVGLWFIFSLMGAFGVCKYI